ncbi:MAG: hypothetical protein ACKVY0_16555 [Prosthecobacter sp.]|uniref:hypothetical protein n=1 Tax=Prosthecobacter sp. TaxID=1965333 RepID=UPI0038FEB68B
MRGGDVSRPFALTDHFTIFVTFLVSLGFFVLGHIVFQPVVQHFNEQDVVDVL